MIYRNSKPCDLAAISARPERAFFGTFMIISKVKAVRVIHLNGQVPYQDETYQLHRAVGVLELVGRSEGRAATLKIGFTDFYPLPEPTFVMGELESIGTITLRSNQFAAYLTLAHAPTAHFRIGNPPDQNAIGLEGSILG